MVSVKVIMNSKQQILLKRGLDKNGRVQKEFTQLCAKEFDPYVPYRKGNLKNREISIGINKIIYNAPYAAKQYYTNEGKGINGTSHGGLRGKLWDKRCWMQRGENITNIISKYAGGRSK